MSRAVIAIELEGDPAIVRDLAAGGAFVTDGRLRLGEECDLVVYGATHQAVFAARVVYVDERGGAGLELIGFSSEMKAQLDELVPIVQPPVVIDEPPCDDVRHSAALEAQAPPDDHLAHDSVGEPFVLIDLQPLSDDDLAIPVAEFDPSAYAVADDEPAGDDSPCAEGTDSFFAAAGRGFAAATASDAMNTDAFDTLDPDRSMTDDDAIDAEGSGRRARNIHERVRGLNLAAQIKMAATGELHERILLERLYGKNVWETLLRNPRLTAPEVSRIARYGSLPRILLEIIVGNNSWLQVPEVRRALLSNPRLATDQIMKILRLTPKHELKLAAIQTAYPQAVRNAAKMMLRGA